MLTAAVLVALAGAWQTAPSCDKLEINHVFEPCGTERFTQVIVWEWMPDRQCHHVRDYKIIDCWQQVGQVLEFRRDGKWHKLRSRHIHETWTENDPERDDLVLFPEHYRVKVFR